MRIIAGDVGGTKTLLRCVERGSDISAERRFESGKYATFDDLLREFLKSCPGPADAACFAVAGPVFGDHAEVTNLGWKMTTGGLMAAFSIPRVALINDFYAVALGVPYLVESDLVSLQKGQREPHSPIAILGAGTGLGQANVTYDGTRWNVIPSEGGHADFAPQDEEQTRLLLSLLPRHGHVSWERVLSGMGLTNIYAFLTGRAETPVRIAALTAAGDDAARRTFAMFVDIYGAEAGNMALRTLARGGVFLAGGIAAKNQHWFTDGKFMAAFLRKGRFQDKLAEIPVDLITNQYVGLIGAMEGARRALAES
jgi:glucokinase